MRLVEDVTRVPATLARWGVRFVLLRHLPKTYLDGAAFWLAEGPVVALTLRYDRIDAFWFTLMHELAHLAEGRSEAYLDQLEDGGEDAPEPSPRRLLRGCRESPGEPVAAGAGSIRRFRYAHRPAFSRTGIEAFAASQGRHPGIVLGRLQREGIVPYRNLRGLLVKVSPALAGWISE